ncbi:restriction endonuclease subunit S [Clostridium perfringens]|uniref:restriction endonuclease subunit S n=1 Tax=Clostridium perfringens TaxID=1502 RepID=UPI001CAEA3CF|nr:restriction endonuclease subunit S [Clostridium perfringens]HBI6978434.1 restriction endonuclease subunit S [Clostridium perfringens]HBI7001446.1 restriction endonuclease subunit S [Clostridium perfringens]
MEFNAFQNKKLLKKLLKNEEWNLFKFSDVFLDNTKLAKKIKKEDYLKIGKYPIIDQGKKYIAGYTNYTEAIYDEEGIIFGDHTRIIKYVNFPLFLGADGTKLLGVKLKKDCINIKYLYYFLKTIELPSDGYSRHFKYLKEIIIAIPSIKIQNKIVEVLDMSYKLIENRKKQIKELDLLVKSKFIEMFGNPVSNPKGWEKVALIDLGELARGKSKHRPRNAPELMNGPYPLIQTGDVANAGIYIKEYTQTYSELGLQQSKMWKAGTLCITIAANIAKTTILTFDACFPDSIVAFIPNEKTNTMFIQFWMSFLQKILEDSAPESAQKNINLKILGEQRVIVPPIEFQNQFADFVKQVDKLKFEMEKSLKELEDNFNSLMQKAFNGELFN